MVDIKSILIYVLITVSMALAYITFTQEPVVIDRAEELRVMQRRVDSLVSAAAIYSDRADSVLVVTQKQDSVIGELRKELESVRDSASTEISIITAQSMKRDSMYFAEKSGEPVIITRDSNAVITPMQLKFANINIAGNELSKGIIRTQGVLINSLSEAVGTRDSLIVLKVNENNALMEAVESGNSMINIKNEELADEKKNSKRKEKRALARGAIVGGVGILILTLLLR